MLVKGTITVNNTGITAAPNDRKKNVIFKNCVLLVNKLAALVK